MWLNWFLKVTTETFPHYNVPLSPRLIYDHVTLTVWFVYCLQFLAQYSTLSDFIFSAKTLDQSLIQI